jgi:hypothetical protein
MGIGLRFNILMFVPHRKYTYRPPRSVTVIGLCFYILMFVPHRKQTYIPPRPVTGKALFFICWCSYLPGNSHRPPWPIMGINLLFYMLMFVSHRRHKPARPVVGIGLLFYVLMLVPHRKHCLLRWQLYLTLPFSLPHACITCGHEPYRCSLNQALPAWT